MDSKNLVDLIGQLGKERDGLDAKANKLRAELAQVETDLGRINTAVDALTGKEPATSPKKAPKKRKAGKPAPSREDVTGQMVALLEGEGVLVEEQLKEKVEARLIKEGFSRMGLALRFKEALNDEQFIDSPGGIRLVSAEEAVAAS